MNKKDFPEGKIIFEIESLGPMRESIINFRPFLLFSGESNTGKSYTAMAVYYLFYMLDNEKIISELTPKLFNIKKIENELKSKKEIQVDFPKKLPGELEKLYNNNISRFMAYILGYDEFSCKVVLKLNIPLDTNCKIHISLNKKKNGNQFLAIEGNSVGVISNITSSDKIKKLEDALNNWFYSSLNRIVFGKDIIRKFLLPPARGAFSGLTPSMWKHFSGIGMYNEFLEGIDSVRFSDFDIPEQLEVQKKLINPLFEKLLQGKIMIERDKASYTISSSNKKIPLSAGSSSVKELFPLYLLLNRVLIDEISVCIEEPEAHLHPELQRSTALLLSYIINHGGFVQATTHSDFFVNQVNNLLKLHFLKNKEHHRFLTALKETGVQREFVLDHHDLGAYYFEKNKDGVHARKLEVSEKGIPLESFKHAYEQSVEETRNLREALIEDAE
ncbi:MAG: AAA family ATPase [Candidatus Aminicenantes bacterium]|nr:MAG: AAA family ATPase [Candidatus Aminicenantes bacterium]